ncbi:signal peptide peptidase SppA [Tenacibaculum jejuense]|uniref:Signal peptide peptidase SppA, 67K type n=1 Tax=Tenacibaculum jejuense TaxID=584609 RepID=A0A238UG17_9FLAO|nr:signal peptide peptidase SppA [Tenacibaculum jejuense]SNR17310.1 Signal peptide peptidase SppA, 67K type [Tenacibaculum jejuense]
MNFLRNLLAAILGFFISLFLIFILFVGIASLAGKQEPIVVKPNSILELDLSSAIKDYAPDEKNPILEALELDETRLALNKIFNALDNAQLDDNIKGISLNSTLVNAGFAQTQALRKKLEEFKESGKFIYAYNDVYTQKNYYLSSVADSIFLNPVGQIDFTGLSSEILYYKDFEDKYGVKMEVIRHGKYKSAVEPYLENKMSDANREQTTSFLKSIWSEITSEIAKSRNITEREVNNIADESKGRNAELAQANKLIDYSIYQDEYDEKLKKAANGKYSTISLQDYIKSGKGRKTSLAKDKIAVIYAQGQIMYGEGNEEIIGQGLINKAIKKAVKDKNVKAIVLRVNSPGGSALASDLIWRELELAKKEKPLVVSMGNLAASGGYYIACNANLIVAEPTTITGSIGVFGAIPNAYELSKRMGINAEQVSTNESAQYSVFEPMNKKFYDVTKEGVEQIYKTFVNRVAEGRKMTFEQVDAVAQGRVWSGKEAISKGLVDELGGLDHAINAAAQLAELKSDYKIKNYPNYKTDIKEMLKFSPFGKVDKNEILREALGDENYRLFNQINELKNLKGIQARMPYILEIK